MYVTIFILSLIIAFFIKGEISDKILAVVIFLIGIFCFEASSFWWRFGFVIITPIACRNENVKKKVDSYKCIAIAFVVMSFVKLIATDYFECDPSLLFNIVAVLGSVGYLFTLNEK